MNTAMLLERYFSVTSARSVLLAPQTIQIVDKYGAMKKQTRNRKKNRYALGQGWANCGPRAACGPRRTFVRPGKASSK